MKKRITAVLIDTSAYHNRQCDFSGIMSAMIPMFLRLMETNHIPILSHPILDNEVKKHKSLGRQASVKGFKKG